MAAENSKFFFSYAREDSEFVLKLAIELRKAGAGLWLDQLDILGGQRWDEAIQAALGSCQGMLAVLSPSSVASQNFMDEVSYALEERKQVIPVLYRECSIPFRLRRVQHVSFTISYETGFADLLRALGLVHIPELAEFQATEGRLQEEVMPQAIHKGGQVNGIAMAEKAEQEVEQATREAAEQSRTRENDKEVMPAAQKRPRRLTAALAAAGVGSIICMLYLALLNELSLIGFSQDYWMSVALRSGVTWAIAGAITGTNRRIITVALVITLVMAAFIVSQGGSYSIPMVLIYGAPLGAASGAIAVAVLKKLKIWK